MDRPHVAGHCGLLLFFNTTVLELKCLMFQRLMPLFHMRIVSGFFRRFLVMFGWFSGGFGVTVAGFQLATELCQGRDSGRSERGEPRGATRSSGWRGGKVGKVSQWLSLCLFFVFVFCCFGVFLWLFYVCFFVGVFGLGFRFKLGLAWG